MEALIDYMVQDDKVGAVCGRTHPMGDGPLVWYQTFDYAVGHWFMKVANHVFGSVLCCPGCFSLYRCKAVRSVLREYSSNVNEAFEFLTKDMGEDRWFCTLMVQNGWRLAYCAAAEDKTYCPQEFEEFYKQRRRWMPSTLANLTLLVSKWRLLLKNNENISFAFVIYQVVLLMATLIGPSIVILFITGGLVSLKSESVNEEVVVILFSILTIVYGLICLFFSQDIQIKIAKLLTFVFAVIMILVTIGLCVQIEKEVTDRKNLNITSETPLEKRLPAGVSTLYLGGLCGIFVLTALFHPKECMSLMHGLWYLLCLPSGYLLLTIYSIANMTDRSWGTREGKNGNVAIGKNENPFVTLWNLLKTKCACCFKCCQEPAKTEQPAEKSTPNKFSRASQLSSKFRDRIKRNRHHKGRSRQGSKDVDSESECSEAASSIYSTKGRKHAVSRGKRKVRHHGTLKTLKSILASHVDSGSETSETPSTANSTKRKGRKFSEGTLRRILELRRSLSSVWNYDIGNGRRNPVEQNEQPVERRYSTEAFGALGNQGYVSDSVEQRAVVQVHQTDSNGSTSTGTDSAYQSDRPRVPAKTVIPLKTLEEPGGLRPFPSDDDDLSSTYYQASHTTLEDLLTSDISLDTSVDEWLKGDLRPYVDNFKKHGYDTIAFITGMTQQELETIGVSVRGHRMKLHRAITKLPPIIIEEGIPTDVKEWLERVGLGQYWHAFADNGCTEPSDLEDLKKMSKENLKSEYKVTKMAHLNMLYRVIQKLKYANKEQKQIFLARRELEGLPTETLEPINEIDEAKEFRFWEALRQHCLLPETAIFTDNAELKTKLADLRNSVLTIFFVSNALWMVIIMVLVKQTTLKTLGVDVLGLSFLIVYGSVTFFQFMAMIFHRLTTLLHILARTPWTCCNNQPKPNFRDNTTTTTQES